MKKGEKVEAHLSIQVDVEIVDYPADHLDEKDRIKWLNEQLSASLTKRAERLFAKLSDNQSDVLGLGRELIAYYPAIWDEIKGDDYYDQIRVVPKVDVRVTSSGATL